MSTYTDRAYVVRKTFPAAPRRAHEDVAIFACDARASFDPAYSLALESAQAVRDLPGVYAVIDRVDAAGRRHQG